MTAGDNKHTAIHPEDFNLMGLQPDSGRRASSPPPNAQLEADRAAPRVAPDGHPDGSAAPARTDGSAAQDAQPDTQRAGGPVGRADTDSGDTSQPEVSAPRRTFDSQGDPGRDPADPAHDTPTPAAPDTDPATTGATTPTGCLTAPAGGGLPASMPVRSAPPTDHAVLRAVRCLGDMVFEFPDRPDYWTGHINALGRALNAALPAQTRTAKPWPFDVELAALKQAKYAVCVGCRSGWRLKLAPDEVTATYREVVGAHYLPDGAWAGACVAWPLRRLIEACERAASEASHV